MSNRARVVVGVAALLLLLTYVFPIWKIELAAPQYPEGLGMLIRINTIVGLEPNHLQNINGLNHYIGMQEIVPESIPELRLMPWVVAGLILLGLGTAVTGQRKLLYVWAGVFVAVAVAGLVDFYIWEYNYGHNLDPTAAIQVPGMSYQPPLIGSRQILNFTASSWPAAGGWAAIVSCLTAVTVAVGAFRRTRRENAAARAEAPTGHPSPATTAQ